MIGIAAGFLFDNPLGKWLAGAALAALVVVGFAWDQRARGAASAVITIEKQDAKAVAKAVKARDPAKRDGSVERLLKSSCRDC